MDLSLKCNEIEKLLGEINSHIPSMDFEFDMGEVRLLRESII